MFACFLMNIFNFVARKFFSNLSNDFLNFLPIFRALLESFEITKELCSPSIVATSNIHSVIRGSIESSISSFSPGLLVSTMATIFLGSLRLNFFSRFYRSYVGLLDYTLKTFCHYSWNTYID